jgi:hypothetical protein
MTERHLLISSYLRLVVAMSFLASMFAVMFAIPARAEPAGDQYFAETGHTVKGIFLDYWKSHGGLPQQGYPLSEELSETSELDGKTYTVQYFERAVFELHPENQAPYNVLLMQLGTFQYKNNYGDAGAPGQRAHAGGEIFRETGFYVGGRFLEYWKSNGGLAQQGYPISNEFQESSRLDGKTYTVQYFERAVFELHPENKPPFDVLLSQLGTFRLKDKNGTGLPVMNTPVPEPTEMGGDTGNCKPVSEDRKSRITNSGSVSISKVSYSGQEYVELINAGGDATTIAGWKLTDKNDVGQSYIFPPGTELPSGGKIQVFTEPGHPYSFNSNSPIWNNCGDALELFDAGGQVVASYAYGTHLIR